MRPRKKLPVLNVWNRSRKDMNREVHAMNGITSSSAGSFVRDVRPRVEMPNEDDMPFPATIVVHATVADPVAVEQVSSHAEIRDRLEHLFSRGRDLASTLIHPVVNIDDTGTVDATEALRSLILKLVPTWHDRPVMLRLALGALAVYHLRSSDYTPVEEVNILWALEGNSFIRAHNGVLFTYHGFSWRKFEGIF